MRILITGAHGQLGAALVRRASVLGMDIVGTDQAQLDVSDIDAVMQYVRSARPHVVFNAAAWTSVDDAEANTDHVFRVNRDGAVNVAVACAEVDALLVHYSTDYVFDGRKKQGYVEGDTTNPLNVYGRSKLESEMAIASQNKRYLVMRTSWVFSEHGNNFVKTMLRLGTREKTLRVVDDQIGKPTNAAVLARFSLLAAEKGKFESGIYHFAQPESTSWHGFAKQIFDVARHSDIRISVEDIVPTSSREYTTAAARPANSVLECARFERAFEVRIPDWHDALELTIRNLKRDGFFG